MNVHNNARLTQTFVHHPGAGGEIDFLYGLL